MYFQWLAGSIYRLRGLNSDIYRMPLHLAVIAQLHVYEVMVLHFFPRILWHLDLEILHFNKQEQQLFI